MTRHPARAQLEGSPISTSGVCSSLPIGLGSNTFGRTTDAAASHRVLDAFTAAGGTLVDTADTYSDGASESIWVSSSSLAPRSS